MSQETCSNIVTLSVITPTRGNFSDAWLKSLLAIKGNVEFVLVFPPGKPSRTIDDSRVKSVISPYKGENIQRSVGILNATGSYLIALDDDDFLHPEIVPFVESYFSIYPDSWCFQLAKDNIPFDNIEEISKPWSKLPNLNELTVIPPSSKPTLRRKTYSDSEILEEVPIAPLEINFNWLSIWYKFVRTDQNGPHRENFNNQIWKANIAKESLFDLLGTLQIFKYLVWMPFWGLDRQLGLFLQAKYYRKDLIIGHKTWAPCQVKYIVLPSSSKNEVRAIFPSDMVLALKFPQYGYLWNLFWEQWWRSLAAWVHDFLRKWNFAFKSRFRNQ